MSRTATEIPAEVLELAELLRPTWGPMSAALRASGVPLNEGDDDDDDKDAEKLKAELDKAKEAVSKKDRELRDLKKDTQKQIDELKDQLDEAKTGDDEKAQLERRLAKLEAKAEAAEERATEAEEKLTRTERERTALGVATRLGFRSPARAVRLLDPDDLESESTAEKALERIAKAEPYMVNKRQRRVEDDPKPAGGKDDDTDDDDKGGDKPSGSKNGDEPVGQDRVRSYYDQKEKQREKQGAAAGDDD